MTGGLMAVRGWTSTRALSSATPSFGSGSLTAAIVRDADPTVLAAAVFALSKSDVAALDRSEAEAYIVACERVAAAVESRQSLAMDTLAARVEDDHFRRLEESGLPVGAAGIDTHGLVASTLSPALHCATRTVQRRLVAARWLACEFGATFDAAWDGDLERRRTEVVVEAGLSVPAELRGAFEALVLESSVDEVTGEYVVVSDRVRELSRAELASRATKIARELDPSSEETAAARARDGRRVVIQPDRGNPGMARWVVTVPTDASRRMAAAVDALAGDYARANPGAPIDAARADALTDLVLSSAEVSTVVELLVPALPATAVLVASQSGHAAAPADPTPDPDPSAGAHPSAGSDEVRQRTQRQTVRWVIPGAPASAGAVVFRERPPGLPVGGFLRGCVDPPRHGALAPEVVARLLSDPDVALRLARLDPDGSIVQDPTTYRPSASVRRRVRSRDGGCRFPGCHVPARNTDLDHVVAFPHGPTDPANLVCLCRTHHGFKHHGGWTLSLSTNGTVTWRAPDGRSWVTEPRPHGIRADLQLTDGLDPQRLHDLRRGWLPGLPVGMTPADLLGAEHCLPDDPPESPHTPPAPPDWADLDPARKPAVAVNSWSALEQHLERLLALAA